MLSQYRELIDCHARLQHAAFEGQRDAVVARAQRAGVAQMVCTSTCERDWSLLLDLAAAAPSVLPCFGWDPACLADRPRDWQHRLQLVMNTGRAAIGMVGLDRTQRHCSLQEQIEVLRVQLELAARFDCPVVLRCGRDVKRVVRLLESMDKRPLGVMWSDFTGPVRLIEQVVRLGGYFCVTGDLLAHPGWRTKRLLRSLPLDRLLLASDSPLALPPAAYAPYQLLDADHHPVNEPANLPHIVTGLATQLALEPDDLAQILTHNALCLFGSLIPSEV